MAALDADPTRGAYWLNYIDALLLAGQLEDARAVLSLAGQQGLEGPEVDELAKRICPGMPAAELSGAAQRHDEAATRVLPMASQHGGKKPRQRDMDTLLAEFNQGHYKEATTHARRMTERFPRHEFGWKVLGVALKLQGRNLEALKPMQMAVTLLPDDVESQYNLGATLQDLGRLEEAAACYRQALRLNAGYADAALNLGVALNRMGRLEEAEESLRRALQIKPNSAAAHSNLGATLQELGRLDEAEASFRCALEIAPDDAIAHSNLGMTLQKLGHLDEAAACLRRALEIKSDYAEAHGNLGMVLQKLGRLEEAEASFRLALQINPDDAKTHNNLSIVLQELGRLDEADAHFQLALLINPNDADTHGNRGNLLRHMGRLKEAEACYRKALQLAPDDSELHAILGDVLRHQRTFADAEASYRRSLQLAPDSPGTLCGLGIALQNLGRLDQAETCFRQILRSKPDSAGVMSDLGLILQSVGRLDEAELCLRQAIQLQPNYAPLYSNLLYFLVLGATGDKHAVFLEHAGFGQRFEPLLRPQWREHTQTRDPERGLRIGFVSADFNNHAVASFIEPVLAQLSGYPQLTLHAYYNNFIDDNVTQRLRGHFAHWNPIADLPDAELAEKIRTDGIDILIDLTGHTAGNRLLAFARKPAPVQASWIGYPGTTGLSAMDYYLADRFLLPPGQFDDQFTEKIVRLPAIAPFQPYEDAPPVSALPALRNGYVTFGSFNRPNKLSRAVIALWAQILRKLPGSRMVLGGMSTEGCYDMLIDWFAEEGIVRNRLDFYPRDGMENYLKLHHQVDICLDTFPYNGGTTTHHALWMGVPTLTLAGKSMSGRVGVANLSHAGLLEFVAERADDFVALGLDGANNLSRLAEVRAGLREHLLRSPLRRPELLGASLNLALRTMWRRWCAELPAEAFEVPLHGLNEATGDTTR